MLYAVVLAGVPGKIVEQVLKKLRSRFPDNYVFRGSGARLQTGGSVNYRAQDIDEVLALAANAVFGTTKRPNGFCRNSEHGCSLKPGGKCSKQAQHSCALQKPDYLILIYHDGGNSKSLLQKFHYSPLTFPIGSDCYNESEKTFKEICRILDYSKQKIGSIRNDMSSARSPLLLPPINFRNKFARSIIKFSYCR